MKIRWMKEIWDEDKKDGNLQFQIYEIVGDPYKGAPLMGEGLIRSQLQHPNTTIKHLNPEQRVSIPITKGHSKIHNDYRSNLLNRQNQDIYNSQPK
jgi:hypothetical protein